jgi:hypothetical protein
MDLMLLSLPKGDIFCSENIEFLYSYFKNDFIENELFLTDTTISLPITVKPHIVCSCPFSNENKPERFWHLITKKEHNKRKQNNPCSDTIESKRTFCQDRAKRIHWIKYMIENWQTDGKIKSFYQKNGRDCRLIIWHMQLDFLVIIKKLDSSMSRFLVTSFIVYGNKKNRYKKELRNYEKEKPTGCEWF